MAFLEEAARPASVRGLYSSGSYFYWLPFWRRPPGCRLYRPPRLAVRLLRSVSLVRAARIARAAPSLFLSRPVPGSPGLLHSSQCPESPGLLKINLTSLKTFISGLADRILRLPGFWAGPWAGLQPPKPGECRNAL